MPCTHPRTVGFKADGRSIAWSPRDRSKEYAEFQLPCGKCISCRLDYARQWAIRCVHESKMHKQNSFITLTYSDEHLKSPKLNYEDFQKFMKKLRKLQNDPMGVFVTGEYGDDKKRPHWHAIIFNYRPTDLVYYRRNERGDEIFKSDTIDRVWGFNDPIKRPNEIGSVTFHSAGYCARYAAKKLVHGNDGLHEFEPISKKSSKHAIGKKYLEKYWQDIFNYGELILDCGMSAPIPRYYEKWLKENKPDEWLRYVTQVKIPKMQLSQKKSDADASEYWKNLRSRAWYKPNPLTLNQRRDGIIKSKFKMLQEYLKL